MYDNHTTTSQTQKSRGEKWPPGAEGWEEVESLVREHKLSAIKRTRSEDQMSNVIIAGNTVLYD